MFHPDQTVLIAAHKYTGAQEIMQRIRYVYESKPIHIRAGVTHHNKGSMEFENGSVLLVLQPRQYRTWYVHIIIIL